MAKWIKITGLLTVLMLPVAANAADYTYTTNSGKITITKYTGTNSVVSILGTIEGLPVTSIGANAFYNYTKLTSVVIPDSISIIGNYAFQNCTNLTGVIIPDSTTIIGSNAFHRCYALTNALIGNSVANIGNWAFYGCTNLTSVIIPATVTNLGSQVFSTCTSLTGITVNASNSFYLSSDGVLFNTDKTTLIQYPCGKTASNYTIPDSVTYIWEASFYLCTSLTNVMIPDSVTSISNWAFAGCRSLSAITVDAENPSFLSADGVLFNTGQTILLQYPAGKTASNYTIPGSVTSIGEASFYSCTNLTSITIPDSVTDLGASAFHRCSSLTNAIIGNNVANVGAWAFSFCTNLTSVVIPDNATNIGYGMFDHCTKLTSITIPDSVTALGSAAFQLCYGLTNALIGNSVANIGDSAFSSCTNLTSIVIPDSVTNLGRSAFYSCTKLTSVVIPDSVTDLGAYAFQNCYALTNAIIGNSVANIRDRTFYYCTNLTRIVIPDSVTNIGASAFYSCTKLTAVYFQGNAPSLGSNVFFGDTNAIVYYLPETTGWTNPWGGRPTVLLSYAYTINNGTITITKYTGSGGAVTIPDMIDGLPVTRIGTNAFESCTGLTSITIGANVTNIGNYAFQNCTNLTGVYFKGNAPALGSNVFFGDTNAIVYYLPGAAGWTNPWAERPTVLLAAHTSPLENGTVEVVQDTWNLSTNLYVGRVTGGNSLIITNGGDLVNVSFGFLGYETTSGNNSMVLTGAGSTWTCDGLSLGYRGSSNKLSVLDGAKFYGSSGHYSALGTFSSSSGNLMLVDGVGTEWTAALIIMADGPHNDLIVSGGAKVNGGWSLVLGARASGDYNTVTVDGAGTIVDIDDDICMGIYWWDWMYGTGIQAMGIGSKLTVRSGAVCSAGGTVMNWNYSTVEIGARAVLSATAYSQNSDSDLKFTCAENPSESGKMAMTGNITLAGNLIVNKASEATLPLGYSVDLFDGNISGTFSSITLPDLPSHLSWDTSLLYSNGVISIISRYSDKDGIPDSWELQHFSNTTNANPDAVCSNGVNTVREAYIAGLNPHDAQSRLQISDFRSLTSGKALSWNAVSGRVYSVYWTTNLLSGFQCLESNILWTRGSFTNSTAVPSGYYKIDVRLP